MSDEVILDSHIYEFEVDAEDENARIDIFLNDRIPEASRSLVQKLIRSGSLTINEKASEKPNIRLNPGDKIRFEFLEPSNRTLEPVPVDFEIIFEDQDLMIINKPPGLMVHPGAGRVEPTLIEGVLHHMNDKKAFNSEEIESGRPGIVHRLDADTSGVMVVAKNSQTHRALSEQFQTKTNLRVYKALLCGVMDQAQKQVESYLHRDPRHRTSFASMAVEDYEALRNAKKRQQLAGFKFAQSLFQREEVFAQSLTLASVKLATGRTHQIRVHAKALGLPVAGDQVYGGDHSMVNDSRLKVAVQKLGRQMLHAETLGIVHPQSKEKLAFQAEPPQDFKDLLEFVKTIR